MIELKIDPEFRDKIPPLTDEEFDQLEENIINDGEIYEPICVWNGTIIDGHNRWKVVQNHPEIPYRTREMQFADKWEAFDWMYKKQLGRRNLTAAQKRYLLGKLYEARKQSRGNNAKRGESGKYLSNQNDDAGRTVDIIAEEQGIGSASVERAGRFSQGLDKAEEVVPGFRQKILSEEVKAPQDEIAEIRNMEGEKEIKSAVEKILNPKTIIKPNIPSKPRTKQTEEEKQIADRVNRIVEIQNDSERDTSITINDLAELVEEDGKDYVSSLRNMLVVRSTLLVGENRQVIANVLENIINEIYKVKELLK